MSCVSAWLGNSRCQSKFIVEILSPKCGFVTNLSYCSPNNHKDPFGDVIKGIMEQIQTHAGLNPLCDFGTQNYEQWVVLTEQNGESPFPYALKKKS